MPKVGCVIWPLLMEISATGSPTSLNHTNYRSLSIYFFIDFKRLLYIFQMFLLLGKWMKISTWKSAKKNESHNRMRLIRELKLSRKPDCSLWLYLNHVCVKPEMNLRFGLNVRSLDRIGNHFYRLECSTHLQFMHKRAIPSAKYRSQKGYVTIFIAQGWLNKLSIHFNMTA